MSGSHVAEPRRVIGVAEPQIQTCRHWRRGGCLFGESCAFAHPPNELGSSHKTTSGGDERDGDGTHADGTDNHNSPPRTGRRPRVNKKGRCGHLRRFLVATFGEKVLQNGVVLDIGGGKGELSFELENLHDARCVVIDPAALRLEKFATKMKHGWYDKTERLLRASVDGVRVGDTTGGTSDLNEDVDEVPKRTSPDETPKKPETKTKTKTKTKTETETRPKTPAHLRLLWFPSLWEALDVDEETVTGATLEDTGNVPVALPLEDGVDVPVEDTVKRGERLLCASKKKRRDMAVYEAWAMASAVSCVPRRRDRKGETDTTREGAKVGRAPRKEKARANRGNHADRGSVGITDAFRKGFRVTQQLRKSGEVVDDSAGGVVAQIGATDTLDSDRGNTLDALTEKETVSVLPSPKESNCECCDPLCGVSPPDAATVRVHLQNATLILGMHSDQATEWIVDFALRYRVRFAVVPCCVCPTLFPNRKSKYCISQIPTLFAHTILTLFFYKKWTDPKFEPPRSSWRTF